MDAASAYQEIVKINQKQKEFDEAERYAKKAAKVEAKAKALNKP
jgi:hypothetical protein